MLISQYHKFKPPDPVLNIPKVASARVLKLGLASVFLLLNTFRYSKTNTGTVTL